MTEKESPESVYNRLVKEYKRAYAVREGQLRRLALARLCVFTGTFIVMVYFANSRAFFETAIFSGLGMVAFVVIQKAYNRTQYLRAYYKQLIQINKNELLRLNLDLSTLDDGGEFSDAGHPYTADLNIFGPYSLFQLLGRAGTEFGRAKLAAWLQEPAARPVILNRQKSVRELTEKLAWRQKLQASGAMLPDDKNSIQDLVQWMQQQPYFGAKKRRRLTLVRLLVSLLSAAALAYLFLNFKVFLVSLITPDSQEWIGYILPLLTIMIGSHFYLQRYKLMAETFIHASLNSPVYLAGLKRLFGHIERTKFRADHLAALHATFSQGSQTASALTHYLHNILELFHQRGTAKGTTPGSFGYLLLNRLFLLDLYCLVALDRWKEQHGKLLQLWIQSLGELEALSAIASFYYANPTFTFPAIVSQSHHINFKAAAHPLISAKKRIANDFQLPGKGDIALITGSNMAGKSTFLRTLGVNAVLAFLGAPVCAGQASLSEFYVFTSMRTRDNLAEGVSSFYAELRRIKYLLNYLDKQQQVLFLLDEVLKGTNSVDKHAGTLSLVRQLMASPGFGLVTTHDLSVATILESDRHISNYSFHSSIEGGEITFDFKLKEGPCQEFNASLLMKSMGIHTA